MTIRTRFAPSPTGYLHIGGARTALYNWMFAREHGGQFILRIEDTDQKRAVKGAVQALMDALRWMGLDWDEGPEVGGPHGPYIQSERAALYRRWADRLLADGHAYKCFCTADELKARRAAQKAARGDQGYDRRCRHLSPDEVAARERDGLPFAVRFKAPIEGVTVIPDVIRGDITVPNAQIADAVLLKSDGLPTYHLANVVDDHFMEISHILRADEWISSAPLHINLYAAFGWPHPVYAHLPLVLNPSGRGKLSKRTQAFDDGGREVLIKVEEFRDAGYLPQALNNFLANVGWAFGDDREKFPIEEAIPRFRLEDINPAPTRLPYDKLDWLNGQWIQDMEPLELARAVKPFLERQGHEVGAEALLAVAPSLRVRLKRLTDAAGFLKFLWEDGDAAPLTAGRLANNKLPGDAVRRGLQAARDYIAGAQPFDAETLGAGLTAIGEAHTTNGKAGPFLGVLRLAVTRQDVSPPVFESIVALGRERALARLDAAIALLAGQ
ncbi:MAG: glutamate--tRNA ligase [Anaerolineae bacterium]|nr:glutamate--tRNA ligase [Anaerolineae bacterium]